MNTGPKIPPAQFPSRLPALASVAVVLTFATVPYAPTLNDFFTEGSAKDNQTAIRKACRPLLERGTLVVLHGPDTRSAAVDLESKFVEAALGDIQTADYRNFAHGRHHRQEEQQERQRRALNPFHQLLDAEGVHKLQVRDQLDHFLPHVFGGRPERVGDQSQRNHRADDDRELGQRWR